MSGSTITLVRGDDWEGVYVDGALILEGSSIDADMCLRSLLGVTIRTVRTLVPNEKWLNKRGMLPPSLSDVRTT